MQKYSVAGTSRHNGKVKVRFANDFVARFKKLLKNDHEEVNLIELPHSMTKADAVQFLLSHEDMQTSEQQGAIYEYVVANACEIKQAVEVKMGVAKPAKKPVSTAKPKVEVKEVEKAFDLSGAEEAPF